MRKLERSEGKKLHEKILRSPKACRAHGALHGFSVKEMTPP
jgi:hypothetical protein